MNRPPRRHQNVSEDYLQQQRGGHSYAHQHPGQSQIRGPIHPQAHLQQNPTLSPHDMNKQAISSQSGIPQQGHGVAMAPAMMIQAQPRPQNSGTPEMAYNQNYYLSRNPMQQQGRQVIQQSAPQHRNPMQMGMAHPSGPQQNYVSATNPVQVYHQAHQGYQQFHQQQYAGHPSATAYQQNQSVYLHQNQIQSAVQAFQPSHYSYRHPGTHPAATPQQQHMIIMAGYNQQPAYQSSQPVPPTYFPQQRNQPPVTNAQAPEPVKTQQKVRKMIKIEDPVTNKDITDEIANFNSPQPTQEQVKPPDADPKAVPVAIEFASRVASLALSKDGEGERTNVSETIAAEIDVELSSVASDNVEEEEDEAASAQEEEEEEEPESVVSCQESTSSNFTLAKGDMELADEKVEASKIVVVEEEPSSKMVVAEVPIVGSDLVVEQPKENGEVYEDVVEIDNKEIEDKGRKSKKNKEIVKKSDEPAIDGENITQNDVVNQGKPTTPQQEVKEESQKEEEIRIAERNDENSKVSQDLEQNEKDSEENEDEELEEGEIVDDDAPVEESINVTQKYMDIYSYKEGQWSPVNQEGRKSYDRDFLMRVHQNALLLNLKPPKLPDNMEVVRNSSQSQHKVQSNKFHSSGSRSYALPNVDLFTPGYVKSSGNQRIVGPRVPSRSSQQGRKEPKKTINISLTIDQDVQLRTTENAWKPAHKGAKGNDDSNPDIDELSKKVRGILNKLTPSKFETLTNQLIELQIDTEEKLKIVMDLIFEKALDEPGFSVAYANMCKKMVTIEVMGPDGNKVNFRKLLLHRCQKEFEKDFTKELGKEVYLKKYGEAKKPEEREMAKVEFEEAERKLRRRSLGNIRFIGEVFKLRMLTTGIMHQCIHKLLLQGDDYSLECVCRLLTIIGKELTSMEKDKKHAERQIDSYIDRMNTLIAARPNAKNSFEKDENSIQQRVKFLVKDTMDCKDRNWVPRQKESGPKTIEQIRQEAFREADNRETELLMANKPIFDKDNRRGGGGRGEDRGDRRGGLMNQQENWTTVTSKNNRIDHKLKISKPDAADDNVTLGPRGSMGGWSKGSSAGGNPNPRQDSPANRFTALQEGGGNYQGKKMISGRHSGPPSRESSAPRGMGGPPPPSSSSSQQPFAQQGRGRPQTQSQVWEKQPPDTNRSSYGSTSLEGTSRVQQGDSKEAKKEETVRDRWISPGECRLQGKADLNPEEFTEKLTDIVDGFLEIAVTEEALDSIKELCSIETIANFIAEAINHVLDRKKSDRERIGSLLITLVNKGIITSVHYEAGLKQFLSFVCDLQIDIPKVWEYLAEVLIPSKAIVALPLDELFKCADAIIEQGDGGKLFSSVLLRYAAVMDPDETRRLWKLSALSFTTILSENEDEKNFVQNNKLEFILGNQEQPTHVIKDFTDELDSMLKKNVVNDSIIQWIDQQSNLSDSQKQQPAFIRALVTTVCESALIKEEEKITIRISEDVLKDKQDILKKYIDNSGERELQAIYAMQHLVNKLEHPQGMLMQLFRFCIDQEIISEDAFKQWESSKDPNEQEGRGVALKSVVQFFTWLNDVED